MQTVELPPEILDLLAQGLVLVEERLLNREIAMAISTDDRLILDLLGAERTKQVLAPACYFVTLKTTSAVPKWPSLSFTSTLR